MKSICPSRRYSSLVALLTMSAMTGLSAPMDIYVTTTGAGDKDGRDWNNAMSNITEAYGLAAFPYIAPVVSFANASGVVFDGCRFIGIGETFGRYIDEGKEMRGRMK